MEEAKLVIGEVSITKEEFGEIYERLTRERMDIMAKALNYVADMTYYGADGEWHFKPGYDPQIVLDAI